METKRILEHHQYRLGVVWFTFYLLSVLCLATIMKKFTAFDVYINEAILMRSLMMWVVGMIGYSQSSKKESRHSIPHKYVLIGDAIVALVCTWTYGIALEGLSLERVYAVYQLAPLLSVVACVWLYQDNWLAFLPWCLAISLLGTLLVIWPFSERMSISSHYDAYLGVSLLTCVASYSTQRYVSTRIKVWQKLVMNGGTMSIILVWNLDWPHVIGYTNHQWLCVLIYGLMGSLMTVFQYSAFKRATASALMPFEPLSFPMASILGWVVFQEQPKINVIIGGGTIALACAYYLILLRQQDIKQLENRAGG